MLPASAMNLVVGAVVIGVLGWTALSDIRLRTIPNWAVLVILALFIPWTVAGHRAQLMTGLAAGGICLAVGYVLFSTKIMGAGDGKLFASVALFAGLEHLSLLILATTLSGGLIAAVSIAMRPRQALVMLNVRGKGDFGRGIPYGVAIALGGMAVMGVAAFGWSWPGFF